MSDVGCGLNGNVYVRGRGAVPGYVAGLSDWDSDVMTLLDTAAFYGWARTGMPGCTLLVGPSGCGKTVALAQYARRAREQGYEVIELRAEGASGFSQSVLDHAWAQCSAGSARWVPLLEAALQLAIAKVDAGGRNPGFDLAQVRWDGYSAGFALDRLIAQLIAQVRRDAPAGGVLFLLDDLHTVDPRQVLHVAGFLENLSAEAPVLFAAAGPANARQLMIPSGADAIFNGAWVRHMPSVFEPAEARRAMVVPAREVGVFWHPEAVAAIMQASRRLPAVVQLYAAHAWQVARGPVITAQDAAAGIEAGRVDVERDYAAPHWAGLKPREAEFVTALAILNGHAAIEAVADVLDREVSSISWVRGYLQRSGTITDDERDAVWLSVPLLGEYALRNYPSLPPTTEPLMSLEQMRQRADERIQAQVRAHAEALADLDRQSDQQHHT